MTVHKMADGCCSAVTPCSWQRTNPTTICNTCREASPSVAAWLAEQVKFCREGVRSAPQCGAEILPYARGQLVAFEAAHAYAVARPDRAPGPSPTAKVVADAIKGAHLAPGGVAIRLEGGIFIVQALDAPTRLPMVPDIADADLTYLAGLAISSKDTTLARIAAALLLAR